MRVFIEFEIIVYRSNARHGIVVFSFYDDARFGGRNDFAHRERRSAVIVRNALYRDGFAVYHMKTAHCADYREHGVITENGDVFNV